MSYDAPPPAHEPPDCQAQIAEDVSDFPSLTFHDCTGLYGTAHDHKCKCGYTWSDGGE